MKMNLLPPEVRQKQRTRRTTAAVVMAGVILLAGVGALYVLQQLRLSAIHDDLRDQQAANSSIQSEINELRRFDELQREVASSQQLLTDLLSNRVFWSSVMRDISLVVPGEVWLTGLTATLADGTAVTQPGAAGAPSQGLLGQMSFTGMALNHRAVALWLARLEDLRGFANPWLSNAQKTEITPHTVVQWTSSVDLSDQVLRRGRRPR